MAGLGVHELDALLERHQVDLTSNEILDQLDSAFATIHGASAAPLSTDEMQFLRAHAGPGAAVVIVARHGDGTGLSWV
jgi:hypothetical protein